MLEIEDLTVALQKQPILNRLNLRVEKGETLALLGASGSGKSTLLHAICGLVPVNSGKIYAAGKDITNLAPHKRNIGLVFQNMQLFSHRSVAQNIAYGLERQKVPKAKRQTRVKQMLEMVQLSGFENRSVASLSGGQAQRIALARALACDPQIILLDEPLSALDAQLRGELAAQLREILALKTAIFVTHDRAEAEKIADRVLLLEEING